MIKKILIFISVFFLVFMLKPIETSENVEKIKVDKNIEIETPEKKLNVVTKTIKKEKNIDNYIFVGDSRFVGMQKIAENDLFFAETGEGLNYFRKQLENIKNGYTENSIIVIGLGVNDLNNIDFYIKEINELSKKYNVAYLSVNPVNEEICSDYGYTITNDDIDNFNSKLKKNLSKNVVFLDSNTYLMKNGFNAPDGLHYNEETYTEIYNFIKKNIKDET